MNNEPDSNLIDELVKEYNNNKYLELLKKITSLQIKYPKSIFLYNLLGVLNYNLGNYDNAILNYNKINELENFNANAYYNLGIVYKKINKTNLAIKNYLKCIKTNPKKFEAYNNLGNIYKDNNEIEKAINYYLQCLEINPKYKIALQNFGICLQTFNFKEKSDLVDKNIINLLESQNILRPVDIIKSLIEYIYLDPDVNFILNNFDNIESLSLQKLINIFSKVKILIILLKITPITDLKIEKVIKFIRKNILENLLSIEDRKLAFELMNAVAQQCFINEYIYSINKEELENLTKLENKLRDNPNNFNDLEIACLASYKPLHSLSWIKKLDYKNTLSELTNQQIKEPEIENKLRKELQSKVINNEISIKVRDQYESNPYPKWTKISLKHNPETPINYFSNLKIKVDFQKIKHWDDLNILVAGCGTGQHAITTATKFENSFITAIDLSSKSLSYAKRKADELNVKNIEFIQMDILDLKNLNRKFNIIESVGVIHHMENPYLGWKILNDILVPNGLMMIGVYSESARKHIKQFRNEIKILKIKTNNENIKEFREKIIITKNNEYELIKVSPDFYSFSTIRDLLFHVQEKRFTISEIKNCLKKLRLKFCGFENETVLNAFKDIQNNDEDILDLNLWEKFEVKNPRIFAGMYQFWCQKEF